MFKSTNLFATVLLCLLTACGNQNQTTKATAMLNTLSEAEMADGWQSLFDGKTLDHWHRYGFKSVGEAWKIANGTFYLDTLEKDGWKIKGGGNIVTNDEYENFHLKVEWKISKGGNSGIMFGVVEDPQKYAEPYETAAEMQVLDNDLHPDGKIPKHRAGDLYDLISCSKETVRSVGEWNEVEIKLLKGKLDFYLNGKNVVSTIMGDENWNRLIAGSKFKDWAAFAKSPRGRISLQDHGNMVWYRNIAIKRL